MNTDPAVAHSQGFTLVELAIVLVIVGLLLGGMLMPLGAQVEQRRVAETQKQLEDATQSLTGYAARNRSTPNNRPYLPCPDKTGGGGAGTANDGQEDRNVNGTCAAVEGNLPWVTLGLNANDVWGDRVRYRVDAGFSRSVESGAGIGDDGFRLTPAPATVAALRICSAANCPGGTVLATGIPAVIVSHGANGYGSGLPKPAPPGTNTGELENADGDNDFVQRSAAPAGTPGGEFDDIISWLSPNVLINRMISAGRL